MYNVHSSCMHIRECVFAWIIIVLEVLNFFVLLKTNAKRENRILLKILSHIAPHLNHGSNLKLLYLH